MRRLKNFLLLLVSFMFAISVNADNIKGRVVDAISQTPLIGATVKVANNGKTLVTDDKGQFTIRGLARRNYHLQISYISYKTQNLTLNPATLDTLLVVQMHDQDTQLEGVTITARVKRNTEVSMVAAQRNSLVVQNGVSAQQISRTQDKDASEVIKRVPGISIIDDKFVMVRGLSQRYNNVWVNGAAVPSTEPDSRAFSFDIIPSSQIDNMQIVKSPAPEYPADFSGGFIKIETKDVPVKNSATVNLGGSVNDRTHFNTFYYGKGSSTDFLGFDNGFRSMAGGLKAPLAGVQGVDNGVSLLGNGFNNNWNVMKMSPVGDFSLGANVNHACRGDEGRVLALLGAVNYSNSYKTYSPMENSLFGAYIEALGQSNYLRQSIDNQYNHDVRLGAMLNLTFIPSTGKGRYEWKNIFNQLGKSRYTWREGYDAQNNEEQEAEYYYSSRTTYNTQFTGKYTFGSNKLDWNAGYAFANRNMPDRRRYVLNNSLDIDKIELTAGNDINREYNYLIEHIASAGVNYSRDIDLGSFKPQVKAGAYTEYRNREYTTRSFVYGWNSNGNSLPADFRSMGIQQLMQEANYGPDKLYMIDYTNMLNDYKGNQFMADGYLAANLPLGAFNIYAGVRFEHSRMELISNTRSYEESPMSTFYDYNDFFPSVNATYKIDKQNQLRLSYGRSINRAEFRELSASVFYDFDLASSVQGNTELKPCYIENIDLRYEWYPSEGDQITLAGFYKYFDSPIEWTYTLTGGTDLVYSYQNADHSTSLGLELDIRKNLGFMGLKDFTLVFNGSLIHSKVKFANGSNQEDRPMQGQSPYLVNMGIFYSHNSWNASLLYNRIGKRLIGVGRRMGLDQNIKIPDSYEMPRNSIDLNVSKDFGKWNVKLGVKDLLAERYYCKQFNKFTAADGSTKEVEEVTRTYHPGRNVNLSVSYTF